MEASKKSKICDFGGVKVQNLRFSHVESPTRIQTKKKNKQKTQKRRDIETVCNDQ